MDQHIINRLRRLLRLKRLKKMSTRQVIIFAYAFAGNIRMSTHLVLTTIGDLYKVSSGYSRQFERASCEKIKDEIRRLLKERGFRRPRWKYGPGGNHILLSFLKKEVTIFEHECFVDEKSFPLPDLAVRYLLRHAT